MRRVHIAAFQVLALVCVGTLLGRQYVIYDSQFSVDTQGQENNATAEYLIDVLPPTTNRVVKNVTGDDDRLRVKATTTSLDVTTTSLTQSTTIAGSTLPTELSIKQSDAYSLPWIEDGGSRTPPRNASLSTSHHGPLPALPSPASRVPLPPTIDTTTSSLLRLPPHQNPNSSRPRPLQLCSTPPAPPQQHLGNHPLPRARQLRTIYCRGPLPGREL